MHEVVIYILQYMKSQQTGTQKQKRLSKESCHANHSISLEKLHLNEYWGQTDCITKQALDPDSDFKSQVS